MAVDKKERSCKTINLAVPADSRIEEKEKGKVEKYLLKRLGKGVTEDMEC